MQGLSLCIQTASVVVFTVVGKWNDRHHQLEGQLNYLDSSSHVDCLALN